MPEEFPILEVPKESAERIEQLGSKRKFWFRREDGTAWLFKFARSNTGEHWAEKIAAEIAQILEIPHARIELATFAGERGSVSPSFVPAGSALIHGNEILADT